MFDAELHKPGLFTSGLFTDGLLGSSAFDGLKRLTHPMVVATKGNNPLETGRYPQPTTVLDLNGSTHYVNFGDVLSGRFDYNKELRFIVSFKTTSTLLLALASKSEGTPAYRGWQLYMNGGKLLFRYYYNGTATGIRVRCDDLVNDGEWHKVELLYDGSGLASGVSLIIDNAPCSLVVELDSGFAGSCVNSANLIIGASSYFPNYFNGRLGPFDILADGKSIQPSFNQSVGTVALDRNDNASPGTLMNSASWVVDNTLPWQADVTNEEGYTLGTGSNGAAVGVIIPPSTIDPTKDCLGNSLQFSGSVYPIIPADNGPNKNCYQVTELGDYTAATVNLGAADDIADSDTKASVLTLTNNRVFKNDTTNEIVAFYDTLTGDDFDKADSYTS